MKMPTAVVRQSFPWKPGNHVSFAPGEGTLASEDRLPCVTQTNGHASGPSPTGNRDGTGPGGRGMSSSGTGQGSGSSTEVKRFPILGPTRQDTEVYFKVRSTRTRSRGLSRGLVTRSADRVVPADSLNTQMAFTSISSAIKAVATSNSVLRVNNTSRPASKERQRTDRTGHSATRSAEFSRHRPGSGHLPRPQGSSRSESRDRRGSSRTEIPIKFLSESGDIRASNMTHRPPRHQQQSQLHGQKEQNGPRTLLPSKHGFHRRSKSPTFKRLVAAVEKLQTAVPVFGGGDSPKTDKDCASSDRGTGHVTSPSGIRLPSVHALHDDGGGEKGWGWGEESEKYVGGEDTQLFKLTGRYSQYYRVSTDDDDRDKSLPGDLRSSTSLSSNTQKKPKTDRSPARKGGQAGEAPGDLDDAELDMETITNGWEDVTAWKEADSRNTESDPVRLSLNMPGSDFHTELHLFLPKLGDAVSESDSVSVAAVSERGRTRQPDCGSRQHQQEQPTPGMLRSRTIAMNMHPHTKGRPPPYHHHYNHHHHHYPTNPHHGRHNHHHSSSQAALTHQHLNNHHVNTNQNYQQGPGGAGGGGGSAVPAERSGRPQNRRFASPVRMPRRDRTPKRKAVEVYEPFIEGEHLREKLDDVPTLISLDLD